MGKVCSQSSGSRDMSGSGEKKKVKSFPVKVRLQQVSGDWTLWSLALVCKLCLNFCCKM